MSGKSNSAETTEPAMNNSTGIFKPCGLAPLKRIVGRDDCTFVWRNSSCSHAMAHTTKWNCTLIKLLAIVDKRSAVPHRIIRKFVRFAAVPESKRITLTLLAAVIKDFSSSKSQQRNFMAPPSGRGQSLYLRELRKMSLSKIVLTLPNDSRIS